MQRYMHVDCLILACLKFKYCLSLLKIVLQIIMALLSWHMHAMLYHWINTSSWINILWHVVIATLYLKCHHWVRLVKMASFPSPSHLMTAVSPCSSLMWKVNIKESKKARPSFKTPNPFVQIYQCLHLHPHTNEGRPYC